MVSSIQTNPAQNIVGTSEVKEVSKNVHPVIVKTSTLEKIFPVPTPMGILKDCCEATFRLVTSVLYVPFYIFSQIFFRDIVFSFKFNEVDPGITGGSIKVSTNKFENFHIDPSLLRAMTVLDKEILSEKEVKFLTDVLAAIESMEKIAKEQRMALKMVFHFGEIKFADDQLKDPVTYQMDRPTEINKVVKKALEYYRSTESLIPFLSGGKFVTYKFAAYTTSPFAWIKSIYGKYGFSFDKSSSITLQAPEITVSNCFRSSIVQDVYKSLEQIIM